MALANSSVQRVQAALREAGSAARVIELAATARSAQDAAASIGCPLGAIVKSLVFVVGDQPVLALVAGDRRCDTAVLGSSIGLVGQARRADAGMVRAATSFAIGGVAPLGHPSRLPVVVDQSLGRFASIYAAAGHPHCVFETNVGELVRVTRGVLSPELAIP
ncbi:MAG: YbaK/EbsC family protein [Alphaproteobacteria bacterium]|nr:YbaK/EbsC family protein [Alphaproteobacteria bacterium]